MIERRAASDVRIEQRQDGAVRLVGYAGRFGVRSVDLGGFVEVVERGAFARSLRVDDPLFLDGHDITRILGRMSSGNLDLREDQRGLRFRLDMPDSTLARDLAEAVRRRDVRQMSFAFRVGPDGQTFEETSDGEILRRLTDVTLVEVSTTPAPAYPQTSVSIDGQRSRSAAQIRLKRKRLERLERGLRA